MFKITKQQKNVEVEKYYETEVLAKQRGSAGWFISPVKGVPSYITRAVRVKENEKPKQFKVECGDITILCSSEGNANNLAIALASELGEARVTKI